MSIFWEDARGSNIFILLFTVSWVRSLIWRRLYIMAYCQATIFLTISKRIWRLISGVYLQQEIAGEGITRNVPAFSRFLEIAALGHGEQIHFTNIANDAQVPRTTIHEYYQILKDTLIAYEVPAWQETQKRKPVATSKYYFFDWGLVRKLQKMDRIQEGSPIFGKAFESFLFQEIKAYCDYRGIEDLHYWRTTTQDEVDFIIDNKIAVEIKAKTSVTVKDLKGLMKLQEEKKLKDYYLVYNGTKVLQFPEAPKIKIVPWKIFLEELWEK